MTIDYSIIIPVYNGEYTIKKLFEEISSYFSKTSYSFEVVFVYDCGKDNSWDIIKQIKNDNLQIVKAIKLTKNFGQHNAIIAGINHVNSKYIITMDEDLQHLPKDIQLLIDKQNNNNSDIVYGKYNELKHSFFRNTTSKIIKKILSISIPDLDKDYSAYRLIKTPIAKEILTMNNSYTFIDGYFSWVTTNTSSVLVAHNKRIAGESAYTFKKLFNHSMNIFFTFSNIPIKILSISSILILLGSFTYTAYLLIRKLFYNDLIEGYASTMIILGFGIGLIIFGLGIIGEYIHRINLKTTKRPNYVEEIIL